MTGDAPYHAPYTDDPVVRDTHRLLRYIHPTFIRWDRLFQGGPGITTQAFQVSSPERDAGAGYPAPGMSVGLEAIFVEHGHGVDELLQLRGQGWGIVALSVRAVRAINPALGVVQD